MSQTKTQLVASPLNLNGADLTFPSTQGSAGQYLRNTGTAGTLEFGTFPGSFTSYAIICDEKPDGSHGGQFTGGSWLTRDLQTEIADPDSIVTIASHRFTLQAGSYLIHASAPAIEVNRHQARLYDFTNSSVIQYGSSEYSGDANGYSTCRSFIEARVTPTAATAYEIQHRGRVTRTSFGFGIDSDFGGKNIYTIVKIFKEA